MGDKLSLVNLAVLAAIVWGILNPAKVEELIDRFKPRPPVVVPEVTLPMEYDSLARQASTLMAKNQPKAAAFVGYFQAVADEVAASPYLKTTGDINQLLERSLTRMNEAINLPSVTDGTQLSSLLEQMIDLAMGSREIRPLDANLRQRAGQAFQAMEWAVVQAAK